MVDEEFAPPVAYLADIKAERCLLGTMAICSACFDEILTILPADQSDVFWHVYHRVIFESLMRIRKRGDVIDLISLRDELTQRAVIDEVGGVDFIVRLAESANSPPVALECAKSVRRRADIRQMIYDDAREQVNLRKII